MPVSSNDVAQLIAAQTAMFSGQQAYAQQLSMQAGMLPPSPWGSQAYNAPHAAAPWGEQMAGRAASFGHNVAMPVATAGLGMMGGMGMLGRAGGMLDPFGSAMSMGARGFAAGGLMGGMAGAAMGALPGYAMFKAADMYAGAFMGGINDQVGMNNSFRNTFRHYGGQGPMGRGFGQAQMGQMGGIVSGAAHGDLTTSIGELTKLTAMGAQTGQFNGVRDVQQFATKFKAMVDTLKTIQTELGGTLTEAMTFMRNSNQSGVFRNLGGPGGFAAQMRTAQATTGLSQEQLFGLTQQGSAMARSVGGRGAQGATGALRTATSLGAALQSGAINNELLSEATGGLTGGDAIQAMTGRLMQHTAEFSRRRGVGRYSIFAMSNAQGTGLDQSMTDRFLAGDVSVGDIRGAATRNVRGMGRARAINREGMLRGALMEEGGLAGQIGIMRLAVGDRVLDQGDDRASLWMQRRMRMSRPEAELMTSLMRNQGAIREAEQEGRVGSSNEAAMRRNLQNTRSVDAFTAHLGQSIQDGLGIPEVRDAGRKFVTKMSQLSERVMNHLLGIAESSMTTGDRRAMTRFSLGRASDGDIQRMGRMLEYGGGGQSVSSNPWQQGLFETGMSVGQQFQARGVRVSGSQDTELAFQRMEAARRGQLSDTRDVRGYQALMSRGDAGADTTIALAMATAGARHQTGQHYRYLRPGVTANAADAYMARQGYANDGVAPDRGSLMARASSLLGLGNTPEENARAFIASGGHARRESEELMRHIQWTPGMNRDLEENKADVERAGGRWGHNTRLGIRGGGSITQRDALLHQRRIARQSGLTEENVAAVMGSESYRSTMDRISGLGGDRDAIGRELDLMQSNALREGGALRDTQTSMIEQMRRNLAKDGRIGTEFMRGSSGSDADRDAVLREIGNRGSFLTGLGGRFESSGKRFSGSFTSKSGNEIMAAEAGYRTQIAELAQLGVSDPNAFQAEMNQLGERAATMGDPQQEQFRALRQDVYERQGQFRNLSGRGRRGRQGATETALGLLTANTIGSAEITDARGRRMNQRGIMRELQRGFGEGATEEQRARATAIQQQLFEGSGMSSSQRGDFNNLIRDTARSGGQIGGDLQRRLVDFGNSDGAREAQRKAVENQQRARDPIAAQTLDLTRQMAGHLAALVERTPAGVPTTNGTPP